MREKHLTGLILAKFLLVEAIHPQSGLQSNTWLFQILLGFFMAQKLDARGMMDAPLLTLAHNQLTLTVCSRKPIANKFLILIFYPLFSSVKVSK